MSIKVDLKDTGIKTELQIGDKTYKCSVYPPTLDITMKLIKAQKGDEPDELLLLEAISEFWESCIEFERDGFRNPKKEIKAKLEKGGKFTEVVSSLLNKAGKQAEENE